MKKKDLENYITRYDSRLAEFGDDPRTLGWGGGLERQLVRFKALTEIGVRESESILDIGCGFGDLITYLGKDRSGKYLGVDINENLLEVGKTKFPNASFFCGDVLEVPLNVKFDWVMSSGMFNAKLLAEDNYEYIERSLHQYFSYANKGLAIDFMSTYVDFQHEDAFHASPEKLFSIAKSLSWRVVVKSDYLPFEFCIYVYRT